MIAPTGAEPAPPVALAGLPAERVDLAVSYLADLQRECQLAAMDPCADRSPGRLGSLAERLVPTFEALGDTWRAAEVRRAGAAAVVAGPVPPEAWEAFAALPGLLDEVRTCQERGEVLAVAPAGAEDLLAWVVEEVGHQLGGGAPRSVPGHLRPIDDR